MKIQLTSRKSKVGEVELWAVGNSSKEGDSACEAAFYTHAPTAFPCGIGVLKFGANTVISNMLELIPRLKFSHINMLTKLMKESYFSAQGALTFTRVCPAAQVMSKI